MEEERRRKQKAAKQIRDAVRLLRQAAEELRSMGLDQGFQMLNSQGIKIEALATQILPELGAGKAFTVPRHRLEDTFYTLWGTHFPDYGKPTDRDRAAVKELFLIFDSVFPNGTENIISRIMLNYKVSNSDWCLVKEMHIMCRNFRKFAQTPVMDSNVIVKTDVARKNSTAKISFGGEGH